MKIAYLLTNRKNIFLCFCLFFSIQLSSAQSLTEQLGGVKTNFIFTTSLGEMEVLSQAIIKRGYYEYDNKYNYDIWTDAEGYSAYGLGMESFWLEFTTTKALKEVYHKKKWSDEKMTYFKLKLIDKDGKNLLIVKLHPKFEKIASNEADLTTYSFNLYSIPIIVLDETHTIEIERVTNFY